MYFSCLMPKGNYVLNALCEISAGSTAPVLCRASLLLVFGLFAIAPVGRQADLGGILTAC